MVLDLFSKYGIIDSLKVSRGGSESYAYVNFSALGSALNVEAEMSGYVVDGRVLTIRRNKPETQYTLKVVNIPAGVDEEDLTSLCEQFGAVHVKVIPGSEGSYAYLNFRDEQEAGEAFDYLNGRLSCSERLKKGWKRTSESAVQL